MSHAVFVPFAAWGHVRPLLHLVVQLVTLHPQLKATILLCPTVAPRVHKELASANLSHTRNTTDGASALGRVQLVEVQVKDAGTNEPGKPKDLVADMAADAIAYAEAISGYLAALFGEGAPGAPILGDKFKDIKPNMVIFDMFQSFVLAVVHQLSEQSGGKIGKIPVFAFVPSGPTSMIHHLAKEEYGGFIGPISRKVEEAVAEGQDPMPMIAAMGLGDHGRMKSLPGLPKMTDYELPQILGKAPVLAMFAMFQTFWSPYLTGTIGTAVEEMETEAKLFFEQHLGKPWLFVGGEIPETAADDADGLKVMAFMDKTLKSHGPKSLVYVSFGSAWFPFARPEIVHYLVDTLISTSTPFLFAYATELFPVSADMIAKVSSSEFGMAVQIAPQVQVLNHPACLAFVSHCGANSTAEAILAGIPIAGIPFAADQGECIEILKKYKAGVDIKQAKCFFGQGEKPKVLYDGTELIGTEEAIKAELVELWTQMKGDLGKELAAGMAELRQLCDKSCHEGGGSRQGMLDLAKYW